MENLNELKPVGKLSPFAHFCCTIGNLPTSYMISLTYEEQLLWLCNYLEKTVIPAVNTNAEAVAELQSLYIQLKDYVDNYFNNLDVQEEINNKLDQMAESGELADIIAQYIQLQGILCFNNIASLKNATNLVDGSFVRTYGFYKLNDKGGSYYKIRQLTNNDVVDNITLFKLDNTTNLIAELIEEPEMYVEQYGAIGDGITDVTVNIQTALNLHIFGTLYFGDGEFLISETLKTYIDNIKKVNIIMNKNTVIKTNKNLESLIEIGGLGGDNTGLRNRLSILKGGILDATNCEYALKINENYIGLLVEEMEIQRFSVAGVYIPKGETLYSSDLTFKSCHINGKGSNFNNYGFYVERPDNEYLNMRVNAVKTGFYCTSGGQILNDVHCLVAGDGTPLTDWFNDTKTFVITSGNANILTNFYSDSFHTMIESTGNSMINLNNSFYYSYINNVDCELFRLNYATKINISNNQFQLPTPQTKHKGIVIINNNGQYTLRNSRITINNNIINDFNILVEGDLLTQTNKAYVPFWSTNTDLKTDKWLKIGYMVSSND